MRTFAATIALLSVCNVAHAASAGDGEWATYGRDKGGQRHSPLTQITPANVGRLQPAWVYHMKPADLAAATPSAGEVQQRAEEGARPLPPKPRYLASQMTPLVVGGRMFITTPYGRVAALDPTTGKELWGVDIGVNSSPSYRGVEYWPGDRSTPPRIVFGTGDARLIALDAATGAFVQTFGDKGAVNLRTAEIMNDLPNAPYRMTSPPLVAGDLVITGSRVQESPLQGASGDVRAWDVRTGKLVWTFHTIPRPGEPNYGTWASGSETKRSGVNVWGFMSVDEKRGVLYMPVAGPTYDRYGGDRVGDNLYGSSLVAVDLKTGKYLWHYQVVHHDIWDMDTQSAPLLFDLSVRGRAVPAVSVVNKTSLMFILDRTTGKPIYPVEERPFPKSETPGEVTSPTQPIPVVTPPLARTSFSYPEDLVDVTPELRAWCDNYFRSNNMKGTKLYDPYLFNGVGVHYPGIEGGASWGGQAYDPASGYIVLPTNNFGFVTGLVKDDGPVAYIRDARFNRFQQNDTRLQCVKPPWGQLTAVDSRTGKIAWQVPIGVSDNLPEGLRDTGRPGQGGAIVTAGGVVFIGFSDDARFRAFDLKTGKTLWTYKLDASAHATPISYLGKDGRQYVAVTSTGGSYVESPIDSDTLTAFALPR